MYDNDNVDGINDEKYNSWGIGIIKGIDEIVYSKERRTIGDDYKDKDYKAKFYDNLNQEDRIIVNKILLKMINDKKFLRNVIRLEMIESGHFLWNAAYYNILMLIHYIAKTTTVQIMYVCSEIGLVEVIPNVEQFYYDNFNSENVRFDELYEVIAKFRILSLLPYIEREVKNLLGYCNIFYYDSYGVNAIMYRAYCAFLAMIELDLDRAIYYGAKLLKCIAIPKKDIISNIIKAFYIKYDADLVNQLLKLVDTKNTWLAACIILAIEKHVKPEVRNHFITKFRSYLRDSVQKEVDEMLSLYEQSRQSSVFEMKDNLRTRLINKIRALYIKL
ncbi:MAG: hypothetical protein L3V56_09380 [Candidatus Magnetoovum sp. WYHC-5]|nr:hypothetical protein [Candidatus Magnetoovum sp. WYHC-5]